MSFKYESIYYDNPIQDGRAIDIFLPNDITQRVSIFFVHGGGWGAGSRTCYHKIMRAFNEKGFICASADYRLVGGGDVDAWDQIADLRRGYDIFVEKLKSLGRSIEIIVHGTSAGAHLAALLALAEPGECGEDVNPESHPWIRPIGVSLQSAPVLFEPWEDIFPGSLTAMEKAAGFSHSENPERFEKLAPMNYINEKSCPVFHLCAEDEHMFPIRYIAEFKEKMEAIGKKCDMKIYVNAEHGFFYDVTRRQQKEAFNDLLNWITQ